MFYFNFFDYILYFLPKKGFLQAKGFEEKVQNSIKVTRVIDGSEPTEFKALFNRWNELNDQKGLGRTYNVNNIGK